MQSVEKMLEISPSRLSFCVSQEKKKGMVESLTQAEKNEFHSFNYSNIFSHPSSARSSACFAACFEVVTTQRETVFRGTKHEKSLGFHSRRRVEDEEV